MRNVLVRHPAQPEPLAQEVATDPRKFLPMPRKRRSGKGSKPAVPESVTSTSRRPRPVTPDHATSGMPGRRRLVHWLLRGISLAALSVLVPVLIPSLRARILPPRLEWMVIGPTVRKSYWISVNEVDPTTVSSREIVRADTPVYLLPVRLTSRRGNLDITSCQFAQGDPSSDHLNGVPSFVRMPGDAVPEEDLEEVCQALLAHDLSTARGKPRVKVAMPDMERHLQRWRALLVDRIAKIPVVLRQDDPVPFLLVCVPRLYARDRDYLEGLENLSPRAQLDLYSRQQEALQRLRDRDFTFDLKTNNGQVIQLRARIQRQQ